MWSLIYSSKKRPESILSHQWKQLCGVRRDEAMESCSKGKRGFSTMYTRKNLYLMAFGGKHLVVHLDWIIIYLWSQWLIKILTTIKSLLTIHKTVQTGTLSARSRQDCALTEPLKNKQTVSKVSLIPTIRLFYSAPLTVHWPNPTRFAVFFHHGNKHSCHSSADVWSMRQVSGCRGGNI